MLAHTIIPGAWEKIPNHKHKLWSRKLWRPLGQVSIIPWRAGQISSKFQEEVPGVIRPFRDEL